VDCRARVWLNGAILGMHEGYFQPVGFDATPALQMGENELIAEVDSPKDRVGIWPHAKILLMWRQS